MSVSVNTPCGEIIGLQREGYQEFRGIPYAEQPIGVARFKAPEPLLPFDEPFKADRFGDSAPQDRIPLFGITQTSEDCLHLNIWTPACDSKKRPVMVWIHGGGFLTGSGSQLIYNGRNLAVSGDVVVVSINYRLGVLGFLYLNDLIAEEHNISANNGLLDQLEALRWIKNNIASFGGDPEDITLFGESAGAMSIATLLACPAAKGLFKRAILQSGAADQVLTRSEATDIARRFLEVTDIDPATPEKLWQLSPDQIIKAQRQLTKLSFNRGRYSQEVRQTGMVLLPVVEGNIIPQTPLAAIQSGEAKDIPLMVGCTRDEWNLFLSLPGAEDLFSPTNVNEVEKSDLIDLLEKSVPGIGERAANLYEKMIQTSRQNATLADVYSAFEGDRMFRIPTLRIAEAHSEHTQNIYMFQFNWDKGSLGACHASDIPLVFGCTENPAGQYLCGTDPGAGKLSILVQNCWIAFARSSDPSTDGVGKWHPFEEENRHVMCFDDTTALHSDPFDCAVELWEGVL